MENTKQNTTEKQRALSPYFKCSVIIPVVGVRLGEIFLSLNTVFLEYDTGRLDEIVNLTAYI